MQSIKNSFKSTSVVLILYWSTDYTDVLASFRGPLTRSKEWRGYYSIMGGPIMVGSDGVRRDGGDFKFLRPIIP